MPNEEEWKPIPGFGGLYEISSLSRVRRMPHEAGQFGAKRAAPAIKMLKTFTNNGYKVVSLWRSGSRRTSQMFYVEKAVHELFPQASEEPKLFGEEWRDVAGYEGIYKISSLGRVFSLSRVINDGKGRNRLVRERIRELGAFANGYPKVELARDGGIATFLVHRLVADAFVPNPLGLKCVHHIDEDKTNFCVDNLEWISRAGNVQDWFDRRRVVISTETIERIIADAAQGKTPAEILASLPRKRKKR